MEAKLVALKDELAGMEVKADQLLKVHSDRKGKLTNVLDPIKKLLDEKMEIQKKLDQKTLNRCNKFLEK